MRFPRYNDPAKLFETRQGRCGEWANAFALVCRAMGFETRYVLDFTDHVWTEVYIESSGRWIHCDSCEGPDALDKPLLYETGWGKKLTYVLAFADCGVADVSRRYTSNYAELLTRRNLARENWLISTIFVVNGKLRESLPTAMRKFYVERDLNEVADMNGEKKNDGLSARKSGSIDWKFKRGEMGPQ